MEFLLVFIAGFGLAALLVRSRTKIVIEGESETIERLRGELEGNIKRRERRLMAENCGWSEGDKLRERIAYDRDFLEHLHEPAQSTTLGRTS